ncbi:MAG TPA: TadE/TadG family type IV pilus assembly protein [Thermoleophilaceae bacterium]|nr:TadE/TadG family type IV pilus assembly protein [Thermoleophilaceae bacterium]
MGIARRLRRSERGQASVELVAALPFVLLVGAVVWQCALAGHTAWLAAHAARAGARADIVDGDVREAVRAALPDGLEHGLGVERDDGLVRVSVDLPLLLHRWRLPVAVGATASLGERR